MSVIFVMTGLLAVLTAWCLFMSYQVFVARGRVATLQLERDTTSIELQATRSKFQNVEAIARHKVRNEYKEEAEKELEERVEALRQKFSKENAHTISQALCSPKTAELKDKINELLEKQFSRMSQEFIGQLVDDSDQLKAELILDIGDKIWDRLQQVKENFKDSPYVLPSDCKLAYTRGNRTVVVIEQQPQIRSVVFTPSLVSNKDAEASQGQSRNGYRFSLAFPHVLFFIVFDYGKYAYHELYFRNKPLLSTREYVYLAPIPNVFRDRGPNFKPMCMGTDFDINKGDTLARQCEFAVNAFWQSTFNDHLGNGNGKDIDKRIKNWRTWQENTKDDPFFALKIQWKQGRSAKGVIESILEMRDHKHELDGMDKEIKSQIDSGIGGISQNVKQAVDAAKNYKLKKKDVDEFLRESVESLLVGHSDKVFEECTKV